MIYMISKSFKIKKTRRRQQKKRRRSRKTFNLQIQKQRDKGIHHTDVLGVKFNNETIKIYL